MAPTDTAPTRPNRKVREGVVVSDKGDKTVVVEVTEQVPHQRYEKTVRRSSRFHVHDEQNEAREGDRVRVTETRPLSKTKRWRLLEIVERAR
jgi:small subunit ribosomal protein S17